MYLYHAVSIQIICVAIEINFKSFRGSFFWLWEGLRKACIEYFLDLHMISTSTYL